MKPEHVPKDALRIVLAILFVALFVVMPVLPALAVDDTGAEPVAGVSSDGDVSLVVGGIKRHYLFYRPQGQIADRGAGEARPLLVVLHGNFGQALQAREKFGFDAYADARGFYVAYPDAYIPTAGKSTGWNDGQGMTGLSSSGVDDVVFIETVVADLSKRVKLDPSRVYVTGESGGAIMAYRLGCESRLFAGVAPVNGALARGVVDRCVSAKPVQVISINGTANPFVSYDGGRGCKQTGKAFCVQGDVISVRDTLKIFATAAQCSSAQDVLAYPTGVDDETFVISRDYAGCVRPVEHFEIVGAGDTWPPLAPDIPEAGVQTHQLDATRAIVDAFFPLPAAQ